MFDYVRWSSFPWKEMEKENCSDDLWWIQYPFLFIGSWYVFITDSRATNCCCFRFHIQIWISDRQKQAWLCFGRWWISNDKNAVLNCACAATLWSLWKSRNHLCFQGGTWQGEGQILGSIAKMLKRWRVLLKQEKHVGLDHIVQRLLEEGSSPPKICWDSSTQLQVSSLVRSPGDQSRPASAADACAIAINFQTLDVVFP